MALYVRMRFSRSLKSAVRSLWTKSVVGKVDIPYHIGIENLKLYKAYWKPGLRSAENTILLHISFLLLLISKLGTMGHIEWNSFAWSTWMIKKWCIEVNISEKLVDWVFGTRSMRCCMTCMFTLIYSVELRWLFLLVSLNWNKIIGVTLDQTLLTWIHLLWIIFKTWCPWM